MHETRISQAAHLLMQATIQRAEVQGYHPDDCARMALNAVGLPHRPHTFVVDLRLTGDVYPFMEKT